MDQDKFRTAWETRRDALRVEHPELNEKDMFYELGKEEELLSRLEQKTGKTKKEITDWLHIMG